MAEILVCDDDRDIVEAIEIYLTQEGHHILKAYDGEQQGAEFCVLPLEPVPFSFGQMRLLQQMALRKCVIVSDAPSILDYVENNRTAMIYKSFDMNDLMRKMRLVNDDHNLKDNVSQNAFEYVKTNCNEQNMAKAIEKFLDEISDK